MKSKSKAQEQTSVPLAQVVASRFNPRKRFNETELAELASSIRLNGVLQAILVRPVKGRKYEFMLTPKGDAGRIYAVWPKGEGGNGAARCEVDGLGAARELVALLGKDHYEIIAGERRVRAARLAGLKEIPARVVEMSDDEAADARLVENDQRADLSPGERAAGYQQRLDAGVKVEELARRIGKSIAYVRGFLLLGRAPTKLQEAIEQGLVPRSTAEAICRVPNDFQRERLTDCVLADEFDISDEEFADAKHKIERPKWKDDDGVMTYREVKELIESHCTVELKQATWPLKLVDLTAAGSCEACPKRAGNDPDLKAQGVRADVCTDPVCFRHKAEAWKERALQAVQDEGQTVLPVKESEKLFLNGQLRYGTVWMDLNEQIHLGGGKFKDAEKLLGKSMAEEVIVAIDGDGRPHRLVNRKLAAGVLAKDHKIKISMDERAVSGGRHEQTEEEKADAARRMAQAKLTAETQREILRQVSHAAIEIFGHIKDVRGQPRRLMRCVAGVMLGRVWSNRVDALLGVAGLPVPAGGKKEKDEAMAMALDDFALPGLLGFCVQAAADSLLLGGYINDDKAAAELEAALGIDRKKIEAEVKTRLAAKVKPMAAAARKTKPGDWQSITLGEVLSSGPKIDHLQRLGIVNLGDLAAALGVDRDLGLKSNETEQLRALCEDAAAGKLQEI